MSDVIQTTVEVPEAEVISAPAVPTREDVKAMGWTKAEIESAEKRGLIAKGKKEEEKLEPKAEEKKSKCLSPSKSRKLRRKNQSRRNEEYRVFRSGTRRRNRRRHYLAFSPPATRCGGCISE